MEGQLKSGTILTSESGSVYTVKQLLGAGGQGEVYSVEAELIKIRLLKIRRRSWITLSRVVRRMLLSCGRRI